ncbi:MAG: hypothetical protein Tsb0020_50740 [Haliangiales bacterium]
MTTKQVDVHFATGRDLLSAYWGHLTGGGLAVSSSQASEALRDGQTVTLLVHIGGQPRVAIRGTVVRSSPAKSVVAFSRSDAKERLLTAAFSAREMNMTARVSTADPDQPSEFDVVVHRLSDTGCCLGVDPSFDGQLLFVGTELGIELGGIRVTGCVVASIRDERWVMFDHECNTVSALLEPSFGASVRIA